MEIILVSDISFKNVMSNGFLSLTFWLYMVEKYFMFITEIKELTGVYKILLV